MGATFGSSSAPSQKTVNLDALFSLSYPAYKKQLFDNIASSNAALSALMKSEAYESQDGGTHVEIPLMYALTPMDWYDGYDELSSLPTDGVTNAIAQWRQAAAPITYSEKERKQNKQNLVKLVTTKLTQAKLGMQEGFATAFMQGAGGATITTAASSGINGASGVDPLPLLIAFDPTTSTSILNINQNTSSWWRNKTKTSAATTYDGFMLELDNIYDSCALGTGGAPNMGFADQTTHELAKHAYWQKFRQINSDMNFNFENFIYRKMKLVMDEKTPDAYTGTVALTYGSIYLLNLQFFHMIYESETDFELTPFAKPTNGDSRLAHILWMGTIGISNRRKQGVFGKIARTLT